jgi:hypothetical protein
MDHRKIPKNRLTSNTAAWWPVYRFIGPLSGPFPRRRPVKMGNLPVKMGGAQSTHPKKIIRKNQQKIEKNAQLFVENRKKPFKIRRIPFTHLNRAVFAPRINVTS